jgi:iron complex transport system substrate-binding protein
MRMRRSLVAHTFIAVCLVVVLLTVVGCGGASSSDSSAPTQPAASEVTVPRAASAPTDSFPITIKHKMGSTVIPRAPERVLAMTTAFRDAAFALGVTPLPARINAERTYSVPRPWAPFAAGWATSTVLYADGGTTPDYAAIAALKPDLILQGSSFVEEQNHPDLSKIAPTVLAPDSAASSWQAMTRAAGAALGRSARAEQVVAELEARLAKVASENPPFKGKTVAVANYSASAGTVHVTRGDKMRFFSALGFRVLHTRTELVEPAEFGRLDVDLLIWDLATESGERAVIEADPRLNALRVMREKRTVYIEGDVSNGFSSHSVLSLQFVLDKITPLLQAVPG